MEKKYNRSTSESNTENTNTLDRHTVGKTPGRTDNPHSALKPGDDYTQAIKINPDGGLKADKDGLSVKAGNGIKVDSNGISIDPNNMLLKGMIMMFSGMDAPTGWAFCDGNNGTPDLRSRFVMCGETISETGQSSSKANGSGTEKSFSKNTTSTAVSVNVTVEDTILTESQIPSHKHIGGMAYVNDSGMRYAFYSPGGNNIKQIHNGSDTVIINYHTPIYAYTSNTGGGQGHNHPATASSPEHNHSVDIIPPYYLLAFIMKL
ncbi:tail fiber protein [Photorhabdus luminescens]|uniref:tail fiber protein n=1 Tax=Photorhabdus luminescens TaxID=29488 RepID=UPI002240D0F3|nr:tail fiber protein [Photorhabdus luminescens]MCW7760606.1 phage tail protein [Photorhabdus luminescens subsp. venezuelensis]